ncbi:LysR family transcriptional regulator [Motiliproteus sp.]|uniref:LysR family transcriptional regulator n=1 Tax=Motiliproteus sp. TaxID=1898955 RepID=UPI003BAB0429
MDAHSLKAFVSVAEDESFSIAAERLFLTQPAISKRIANLEQQLGCRLFDRIGRKVSLTEPGRLLLPRARSILLELEDTRRLLSNRDGRIDGKLSLATSHHISLHRLPPVLRSFHRRYAEVELDLRFLESEVAYDAVLSGEVELAVITLAPDPDPKICASTSWEDELCYCCAADHPLATMASISLQDLTNHRAILPSHNTFTRALVEQRFAEQQLQLQLGISTNNLDTIRMMVSIGLGWSLLPETLLDPQLHRLALTDNQIRRPLGLIYHRDRTLSNAAEAFIETLNRHSMNRHGG